MSDAETLQGFWWIVSLEVDGNRMNQTAFGGSKIVMQGNRFTTVSMGASYGGTFSVDEAASPRQLDLQFTEGPHKGSVSLAIYALDGDNLKLCIAFAGRERPTEFAPAPGRGHALELLERESVEATVDPVITPEPHNTDESAPISQSSDDGGDLERLQGDWRMVSGEMGGLPLEDSLVRVGKRVNEGSQVTVRFGGQLFLKATVRADAAAVPKQMDYTILEGPNAGKVQYAIYAIDGDTARFCFAPAGRLRPTNFTTTESDQHTVGVWRRA